VAELLGSAYHKWATIVQAGETPLTGPDVILLLKVLVSAVTVILVAAIAAIATGHKRLHGRLNTLFFVLTMLTVVLFEGILRFGFDVAAHFSPEARSALRVHLVFAIPSAIVLPVMYWSGVTHRRRLHLPFAGLFVLLWLGTFITGVCTLPHE
jgi:uncharacterized membrane protein YozB (DUF420 family)